jgi:hypothetical protein
VKGNTKAASRLKNFNLLLVRCYNIVSVNSTHRNVPLPISSITIKCHLRAVTCEKGPMNCRTFELGLLLTV